MFVSLRVGPFGLHDGSVLRDSYIVYGANVTNAFTTNIDCHSDGFVPSSPPILLILFPWLGPVGYPFCLGLVSSPAALVGCLVSF